MVANERQVCCCGASSWCKVIAWLQIVGSTLLLIGTIILFVGVDSVSDDPDIRDNKGLIYGALAVSIVTSLLGLIMGIILLKGTNQKRVVYLKAWLIYGIISVVLSILSVILTVVGGSGASGAFSGVFGIGVTIFTIAVVWTHKKDIEAGVFNNFNTPVNYNY